MPAARSGYHASIGTHGQSINYLEVEHWHGRSGGMEWQPGVISRASGRGLVRTKSFGIPTVRCRFSRLGALLRTTAIDIRRVTVSRRFSFVRFAPADAVRIFAG